MNCPSGNPEKIPSLIDLHGSAIPVRLPHRALIMDVVMSTVPATDDPFGPAPEFLTMFYSYGKNY